MAEDGIDFEEPRAGEDVSLEDDGEDGFDAGGAVGEEGEGSGGGDGGGGGVSLGAMEFGVPSGAGPEWKGATFVGELFGGVVCMFVEEVHDLSAEIAGGGIVVRKLEEEEGVGETHEAEAHLAVAFAHAIDAVDVIVVEIDDIIEESMGETDGVGEGVEVETREVGLADLFGVALA